MATRTVTGTIRHADGTAWVSGTVKFTLMEPFTTGTDTYPTETHSETTDSNGAISTALGVPASGSAHYYVELPDQSGHSVYLEAGASIDLATLLALEGSAVDVTALTALIAAAELMGITNLTTTHTVAAGEEYLRCNGTFTVTLLASVGAGRVITIKNIGTGTITVTPAGTDTIDGETTWTLVPLSSITIIDAAVGTWDA